MSDYDKAIARWTECQDKGMDYEQQAGFAEWFLRLLDAARRELADCRRAIDTNVETMKLLQSQRDEARAETRAFYLTRFQDYDDAKAQIVALKAEVAAYKVLAGTTEVDNVALRAEVEKHRETLRLALVAIAGGGICTPVEGYDKAPGTGWLAKNIGELRARLERAEAVCEAVDAWFRETTITGYNKRCAERDVALDAWREGRGQGY